jgi:polyisoprenoid-binding protein YceI
MQRKIPYWFALGLVGMAFAAMAADSTINAAKSSITATFKQENVPVDAPFRSFSGHIDYDAAKPAAAKANLELDPGSIDLGSDDYSAEVRKKSWFDTATYPKATFSSTSIKPGAAGHFEATGTLTLKGKAQTIVVPVTVATVAGATAFDGAFDISRAAYGIGDAQWNDVVDDKVHIKFHLVQSTHP